MTSLYPATSATSRAGIASATQGSRPAFQSRMTAASIIRRSASGSAMVPNRDSTFQRRASQPSIWSVTPAAPKTIAAGQLCPPSEARTSPANAGIMARRAIVSAFGTLPKASLAMPFERPWRLRRRGRLVTTPVGTLKGYGGLGLAHFAGLRQRAQPCVPAGLARPHGGRGLLGLARVDAGPGRGTVPGTDPFGLRPGLPRDAVGRL